MEGCGGGLIFVHPVLHHRRPSLRHGHLARRPQRVLRPHPGQGLDLLQGPDHGRVHCPRRAARPSSPRPTTACSGSTATSTAASSAPRASTTPPASCSPTSTARSTRSRSGAGLQKIEDRIGDVTTFSRTGITSSSGPSVDLHAQRRRRDHARSPGPTARPSSTATTATATWCPVTDQLGRRPRCVLPGRPLPRPGDRSRTRRCMARFEYHGRPHRRGDRR